MAVNPQKRYTLEEYLELDRKAEERLEYWRGEIFNMSGASAAHSQIETNLIFHLRTKLAERNCRVFAANMRLKVPTAPPYRYGDFSALCGEAQYEKIGGVDALVNPALVVEVLSTSTESYDRGEKFTQYKSIPSLSEYLLIDQYRPHVTQFVRQPDGAWLQREFSELGATFKLKSLDCEISLGEIYQEVVFTETTPINSSLRFSE